MKPPRGLFRSARSIIVVGVGSVHMQVARVDRSKVKCF